MDQAARDKIEAIRAMESSSAADWLIENQQRNGCAYISKRTWKKEDQIKLAAHYLESIPHASGRCYESLLTVMPVQRFVTVLRTYLPVGAKDIDLLCYCLYPALEKFSKTDKDKAIIAELKDSI
ncbi:MAG: hypothetical protein MI794_01625 [Pseudomonadales bacterium]|nr:hypothetical protein [Pseudomonadales bacterium]